MATPSSPRAPEAKREDDKLSDHRVSTVKRGGHALTNKLQISLRREGDRDLREVRITKDDLSDAKAGRGPHFLKNDSCIPPPKCGHLTPRIEDSKAKDDLRVSKTERGPRSFKDNLRVTARHADICVPTRRMRTSFKMRTCGHLHDANIASLKRTSAFLLDAEVRSMTTIVSPF